MNQIYFISVVLIDFNGMTNCLGFFSLLVKESYSFTFLCYCFFSVFLHAVINQEFLVQIICTQLNGFKYFNLIQIICTQLNGFKYSYLIQIIFTHLYSFKYSYQIQIIFTQLYSFKYSYQIQIIFTHLYSFKYSYQIQIIFTQLYRVMHSYLILIIIWFQLFLFNNNHLFAHSYTISNN